LDATADIEDSVVPAFLRAWSGRFLPLPACLSLSTGAGGQVRRAAEPIPG
jgi:hypothetical protein